MPFSFHAYNASQGSWWKAVQWFNAEHKHSNIKEKRGARKEFISKRLLNNVDPFMCIQVWCLFLAPFSLELKDKSMACMALAFGAVPVCWVSIRESRGGNGSQTTFGCLSIWETRLEKHLLLKPSNNHPLLNNSQLIILFFLSLWGALHHYSTMHAFSFHWNAMVDVTVFKLKTECAWIFFPTQTFLWLAKFFSVKNVRVDF